jgi:hypothetical protein
MKGRLISICLLLLLAPEGLNAEIYLWPLHGPRRLSSSFGEYRNGHFHAGIDLRTFGRTGLPCLAVEDGTAVRVKIAPFGYGKALYVRLDDGATVVYAHVDGFTRAVDSLAYAWRTDHEVSWCDLTIPADIHRFSVGDTVCFTGTTGTIAPHLHFEIRDGRERPLNPLESIYRVPDSHPPIISGLEVVPLTSSSSVNDSPVASLFRFRASGSHYYTLGDTLRLEGLVGLGVNLWDEQGYGGYRLAPFEVELSVDGAAIYSMRNSVFDYSQTAEVVLEYDSYGDDPVERYLVLYSKRGSTLEGREGNGFLASASARSEGAFTLTEGCHELEISVRDAAGNTSKARLHALVGRRPLIEEARVLSSAEEVIVSAGSVGGEPATMTLFESIDGGDIWVRLPLEPFGRYLRGVPTGGDHSLYHLVARDGSGMISERYFASPGRSRATGGVFGELLPTVSHTGLSVRLESNRVLTGEPSLRASFIEPADTVTVRRTGPRTHVAVIPGGAVTNGEAVILATGTDYRGAHLQVAKAIRLFDMERGREHSFYLGDTLHVGLVARRLWSRGLCLVEECPLPGAPGGGLVPVSTAFRLDYREDRIAQLRLICEPGGRVGLFRWSDGRGWKCVGVPAMEGGEITIPAPGIYAFLRDGLPPGFDTVAIEESPPGSGFFKPFRYYVPVTEPGCGVDPYGARAFLNGEWIVCEWDEPRNRLNIPLPASYPAGPATLRIEISDRAGNSSVGEFGFVIQ